ncbi:MAG: ABC transporter ATP-binding protein, partial [Sphingobacteriaceae bacterium]
MSTRRFPLFLFYIMKLLITYLKTHRGVVLLALFLAAINQGFSLLDPYITGRIVDRFINKAGALQRHEYIYGVLGLVALAVGAAMVSRIAKNFQDYYTNIITQKVGARMYADGLEHSLK